MSFAWALAICAEDCEIGTSSFSLMSRIAPSDIARKVLLISVPKLVDSLIILRSLAVSIRSNSDWNPSGDGVPPVKLKLLLDGDVLSDVSCNAIKLNCNVETLTVSEKTRVSLPVLTSRLKRES